ncbi:MAG: hypothetical protein H6717_30680 [Polyangiaceae bacterium]|nr:hypothetical protein [Polyangiaceae bacterium]
MAGTRVLPVDASRIEELSRALGALRAGRDPAGMRVFLARYEADQRQAERGESLVIPRRAWQERWLEVRDLLGNRMPRVTVPNQGSDVVVRKLGWKRLQKETARAWELLRVAAPDAVVAKQKDTVRAAYRAAGWADKYAPEPPPAIDLDFWSLPVHEESDGIWIGELEPEVAEQHAWLHAQELMERGVALCAPPLTEPDELEQALPVLGKPLLDTARPAARGWVEPSLLPRYTVGSEAERAAGAGAVVWWRVL